MKVIPIRAEGKFKSVEVFEQVLNASPQRPLSVDEIRKRCRVLDEIEKINGHAELKLEDLDHLTLKQAMEGFPFNIAHKDLLRVIDDVMDAKAPEAT